MFSAACILKGVERRMILLFEQEEQQALWLSFKDASQGLSVSWPSRQPWQEVSLQTWWSHSYRKHAHPPAPAAAWHAHTLCLPLQRNIQRWHLWFTLHHWAHHRRSGSQHFSSEWHLCQGTELGSALSGRDECSSSLHLHEGNCEQMSMRAEIYNTIVLQVQGFINFSHRTSSSLRAAVFRKSLPPEMFIKNCLGSYFSLWLNQFHFSTLVSVHQFVFMHSYIVYAC